MPSKLFRDLPDYSDAEIAMAAEEDPIIWTYKNIRTEKQQRIDLRGHKYQIGIIEDESPDQIVKKGSQVGMTTIYVSKLLRLMDLNNLIVIYTFPTASDVFKFSKGRFKPMITASPYLRDNMTGADNASMKGFKNSFIYFSGAFSEGQSISIPADVRVHDELDFSNPDVIESYSSRLSASKFGYTWMFSTPTLPEYGIDAEFNKSDQRNWIVKCEHCNTWQQIKYPNEIEEGPFNVFRRKRPSGIKIRYWGCNSCHKPIDRNNGEWVAKYRKRHTHGYFISPTICSWIQPINLRRVQQKVRAKRIFYNFHLGLAYTGGVETLSRDLLINRTESKSITTAGTTGYFMGVDQGDILHLEISRMREDGGREVIYVERPDNFERVGQLIQQYGVRSCVLDALPNKHSAKQLAQKFPNIVRLSYYSELKTIEKQEVEYADGDEPDSILIDRSESLDASANQWSSGQSSFAYSADLVPYSEYDNEKLHTGWLQQMCNMKRDTIEDRKGQKKVVWKATGADHFRHADNYNYIAWKLGRNKDVGDIFMGETRKAIISSDPLNTKVDPISELSDFMVSSLGIELDLADMVL